MGREPESMERVFRSARTSYCCTGERKRRKAWQGAFHTATQFLEGFYQVERESSCQGRVSEECHISWEWISVPAFIFLVCSVIGWAQILEGQPRYQHGGGFRAQELGTSVNYASHCWQPEKLRIIF